MSAIKVSQVFDIYSTKALFVDRPLSDVWPNKLINVTMSN